MTDSFPLSFNELSFSKLTPPFALVKERHQTIHITEKHFETITDEVLRISLSGKKLPIFFQYLGKCNWFSANAETFRGNCMIHADFKGRL